MTAGSADILADAVALLKQLPRDRHALRLARRQFERFVGEHRDIEARLIADRRPANDHVEFDVLLTEPEGTIAVSWHAGTGTPWTIAHAEHWAANAVLTVNGVETSIQAALIYLNAVLGRRPDFMRDLVERSLMWAAVEAAEPDVDEAELDAATTAFRAHNGLDHEAALTRWLEEMHLTEVSLRELVRQQEQIRKLKSAVIGDRVDGYFETRSADFDRMSVLCVELPSHVAAETYADAWRRSGSCPALSWDDAASFAEGRLSTIYRYERPELADASVGAIVAPPGAGQGSRVYQVINRAAAVLDSGTRARIGTLLFQEWLDEQRRDATIRWHWM